MSSETKAEHPLKTLKNLIRKEFYTLNHLEYLIQLSLDTTSQDRYNEMYQIASQILESNKSINIRGNIVAIKYNRVGDKELFFSSNHCSVATHNEYLGHIVRLIKSKLHTIDPTVNVYVIVSKIYDYIDTNGDVFVERV